MTKEVFVYIQCEYSVCSVHWQQEVMSLWLVFTFGVAHLHVVLCAGGWETMWRDLVLHIVCLHLKDHHLLTCAWPGPFLLSHFRNWWQPTLHVHSTRNTLCSICICTLYPQLLLLMLNYEFSTQSHDVIWLVEHHVTVQDELTVPLCDSVCQ